MKTEKAIILAFIPPIVSIVIFVVLVVTVIRDHKRIAIAERAQVDQDIQLRELRTNLNEFIPAATNAIVANKKSIDQIAAKVFPQPKAKPAKQKAKP